MFYTPAAQQAPSGGTVQYVVQRGDSLWSIARKYKVKVSDLQAWNELGGSSNIKPGQSIRIKL